MHTLALPRICRIPGWAFPVTAGLTWLITLASIFSAWLVKGSPHYPEMWPSQHLAYISNAGASDWGHPLFVVGSTITAILFAITFVSERWLRQRGKLLHSTSKRSTVLWTIAAILTLVATIAQVLFTVFCVRRHPIAHYTLVAAFTLGNIFAATVICAEKKHICDCFPHNDTLRRSMYIKIFFIAVEIVLVVAGSVTMYRRMYHASVIIEWLAALLFSFYICSFAVDFTAVQPISEKICTGYSASEAWDEEVGVSRPKRLYRIRHKQYVVLP